MVTSSEIRAKKQAQLLQESQNKGVAAGTHREALLDLLPDGADFDSIRDAVLAPAAAVDAASLSDQQKDDLRQFQMDNAFLQAEVTVLQKKLAYQKIATKQHAWAEAVLVRMDDKTLKKLKKGTSSACVWRTMFFPNLNSCPKYGVYPFRQLGRRQTRAGTGTTKLC